MVHTNLKNIRADAIKLGEALKVSPQEIVYYGNKSVQIIELTDKLLIIKHTSPQKEEIKKYIISIEEYQYLTDCLRKFKKS